MTDSRERLLEGMIQALVRYGYAGASVARVIERAGTSRATFYGSFADREECFLAAHRRATAAMTARVSEAARTAAPGDRPRAVLSALLGAVAEDPAAVRMVLIEALGAPRRLRGEPEAQIAAAEGAIERHLSLGDGPALQIPAAALLGGIVGVISTRFLEGRADSLPGSTEDLLGWLYAYELPAGQPLTDEQWRALGRDLRPSIPPPGEVDDGLFLLPRGRSALPEVEAARLRRERILAATARTTREKGYLEMTVADIVANARVSRDAFYFHFRGKEDAFLAAQTVALQRSIGAAASQFFVGSSWPERVWSAGAATLGYFAAHPDLTHLGIVETHAAGEAALLRQHDTRNAYTIFLEEGYREHHPDVAQARVFSDAIAWAVFALVRREVVAGRTARLLEILPQSVYTIIAPFVGPVAALEFVELRSRSASRGDQAGR